MKLEKENRTVRLSVRELVEWVLRSGDIDNRRSGPAIEDAMLIGAETHRKLQAMGGTEYSAEVPVKIEVPLRDEAVSAADLARDFSGEEFREAVSETTAYLQIDGRADGVIRHETPDATEVTIDEIKGVYREVALMESPVPVHLAQAEIYAYIIAREENLSEIKVQMTYVELEETKDRKKVIVHEELIKRFTFSYTFSEIEAKFLDYVEAYRPWVLFTVKHREERAESVLDFSFPYPYRPGQKSIVREVYRNAEKGGRLFVEAPTGIGKTLAMLYPTVQAVGRNLGDRIFYLTAKTVTGSVAEEGLRVMEEKGLRFSYTKITAKEKMCPYAECVCDPVHCERAKGHFTRVNEGLMDLITRETMISSEKVLEYAEKYALCPYEFSLDASLFTDVIICDYNYVFSPHVYLHRYFQEKRGKYFLLVDEAHNLPERARELFSAVVVKEELLEAKKLFPGEKTILKWLEKANKTMLSLKRECDGITVYGEEDFPMVLYHDLAALEEAITRYLDRNPNPENGKEKLDFYFKVKDFVTFFDAMDDGYVPYASFTETGEFFVKLFCIQPAEKLSERLDQMESSVFFSATFLPVNYYKELITGDAEDPAIYVDSPFDKANRCIFIEPEVSTKYTRRGPEEYRKIAELLRSAVTAHKGNYLAFFPSHRFLEDVERELTKEEPVFELISQKKNMTEAERQEFLSRFETSGEKSLLALSVTGGLFSEGIDLRGERLIGVFVVGTGLPQVSPERDLIKNYYDTREKNGFDYAYRFPGFNKVMQAAGRLIRTTEDRGIIFLMDERFRYRDTKALFPKEWADAREVRGSGAVDAVRAFWKSVIESDG